MRRSRFIRQVPVLLVVASLSLGCGDDTPSPEHEDAGGPSTTLRQLAARAGKRIGAAVDAAALATDETYASVLAREFDYVTPENAMKWGPLEPVDGSYAWADADDIVEFAEAHGQEVKGHTLVWHRQTPSWVDSSMSADELSSALEDHITTTMTRYKGRLRAWDVVNEAVDVATDSGFTQSVFYEVLGPSYIADAFRWARAADPEALLFYNEVGIERLGEKSDFTYDLMQELLDQGVPIDGIGLQSHVSTHRYPSLNDLQANLRRFASLGLVLNISEVDARTRLMPGEKESRLFAQRIAFQQIVSACVLEAGCEAVTFWGFTDKYSWINDEGPEDPLLFDRDYEAKPAYDGVVDGLAGERPALGPNLVPNGDFSQEDAGWSSDAELNSIDDDVLDMRAVCVTGRDGGSMGLSRAGLLDALSGGGPFSFQARVRIEGAESVSVEARLLVEEPASGEPLQELNIAARPVTNGEWMELAGYFGLGFESSPTAITLTLSSTPADVDLCVADVRIESVSAR